MLVVMQEGATEPQIDAVQDKLVQIGYKVHRITGVTHSILGGVGPDAAEAAEFEVMPGVKEAHRLTSAYKLANRSIRPEGTVISIGDIKRASGSLRLQFGAHYCRLKLVPCKLVSFNLLLCASNSRTLSICKKS